MTKSSDGYVWKPGSKEDPFADYRRIMERRFFIALKHGDETRAFFDEVQKQGFSMEGDEKKIQKLDEAERLARESESAALSTHVGPYGDGGMQATISIDTRAHKEQGINAAIASLGNRTGDSVEDISRDLKEALRARGLDLGQDDLNGISTLLAEGEEVVVGLDPQ